MQMSAVLIVLMRLKGLQSRCKLGRTRRTQFAMRLISPQRLMIMLGVATAMVVIMVVVMVMIVMMVIGLRIAMAGMRGITQYRYR
jgi:hypothetical protein